MIGILLGSESDWEVMLNCSEKLEEFKRLMRRETGASEEEYEALREKKEELAVDKTKDEWAKFQAEKNKKRKGNN